MADTVEQYEQGAMSEPAWRKWFDKGDGTHAPEMFIREFGETDDGAEVDPSQSATHIALLKGNLQVALDIKAELTALNVSNAAILDELVTLNAAIAAGISVDIL